MTARLPDPRSWQATSVRLPESAIDPLALGGGDGVLFAEPGMALLGRGVATIIDLPQGLEDPAALAEAQGWLAGIAHSDRTDLDGAAVRAFGALPFDPAAPGQLLVPELTVGHDDRGRGWATLLAPTPLDPTRLERLAQEIAAWGGSAPPRHRRDLPLPSLEACPDPSDYARAVGLALGHLADGPLQKVVLARSLVARFAQAPDVDAAVGRLHAQEPSCTVFSFPAEGGRFFGASPELLVRRRGDAVTCHPLAGTVGLDPGSEGTGAEEAIRSFLDSAKDRLEHRLVVEAVAGALAPWCDELEVPPAPSLVRLRSVAHLGTTITATLSAGRGRPPGVLELLATLHPTPAVGGVPSKEALALIDELEPTPRGRWAGPVGWVDAAGDGAWVIGIRSAAVDGRTAVLHAGAGIVEGSEPEAELEETTVKLAPVLEALWPGAAALLAL